MTIYHCDGGASVSPPDYVFRNAYFTVIDDQGNLVESAKNIGDMWSGLAEFMAIKWVIENIKTRPITITTDCTTAIAWAKKGGNKQTKKITVPPINAPLTGVTIRYQHNNPADIFNLADHPKYSKTYYYNRYRASKMMPGDEFNRLIKRDG